MQRPRAGAVQRASCALIFQSSREPQELRTIMIFFLQKWELRFGGAVSQGDPSSLTLSVHLEPLCPVCLQGLKCCQGFIFSVLTLVSLGLFHSLQWTFPVRFEAWLPPLSLPPHLLLREGLLPLNVLFKTLWREAVISL